MISHSLFNVQEVTNEPDSSQRNSIYKYGSKPINMIAVTTGLIEYLDGCFITDFTDIIIIDH